MSIDIIPDFTGVDPNYKSMEVDETFDIPTNRLLMPSKGVFYTESLILFDKATNKVLRPLIDYKFLQIETTVTAKAAKEAALYVAITPGIVGPIQFVEYQFVGGIYIEYPNILKDFYSAFTADVIETIPNAADLHTPDMLPVEHILRSNVSSFGWEFAAWAIDQITRALLIGDEIDHEKIRDKINALLRFIEEMLPTASVMVNEHITNYNNPHNLTAAQVNSYSKQEFDTLMLEYLLRGRTAYDTSLLESAAYNIVLETLRSNINAANITIGTLPFSQAIGGFNPALPRQVLTAGGWFTPEEIAAYNEPIFYYGTNINEMFSTFVNYPIGTTVTLTCLYVNRTDQYGNSWVSYTYYGRETWKRVTDALTGWVMIYR